MSNITSAASWAGAGRLDGAVGDRIFVRGLVLPVAVGVYDEEQGVTQKVSFTVEATVAPSVAAKGDAIAEVPSYDDLVGAVRAIVADGHINLVETLAERIAERCLRDKRIVSVLVRVEKLERGPASVGVEIVRPRMALPNGEHPPPQALSARSEPTVVKLGGSLAESMRLASILDIVGRARAPVVIVPGGGAFADAVRRAQADFRFSDAAAHHMALLAMHQTGLMLAALQYSPESGGDAGGPRRIVAGGAIPVWLPFKLAYDDGRITADWSTTSDGLAARLAERLGRAPVVLIKSCRIAKGSSVAGLAREGIVDPAFKAIVERARLPWRVLGAGDEDVLAALLGAEGRTAGGGAMARLVDAQGVRVLSRDADENGRQNPALRLGVDGIGALLQGEPRDHARAARSRRVRIDGGCRGRPHVPPRLRAAGGNAHLQGYDGERRAGRQLLLRRLSYVDPGAGDLEHGGQMRLWYLRQPGDQRVRTGGKVPGADDRVCLRQRARARYRGAQGHGKGLSRAASIWRTRSGSSRSRRRRWWRAWRSWRQAVAERLAWLADQKARAAK